MNKKTIAIFAVCMVLVAALSVFSTLALLQDSKALVNTFTTGNVKIELTEYDIVADNGTRTSENQSFMIYPNESYEKDPMVSVLANSEDCYVGATITVSGLQGLINSDELTTEKEIGNFLNQIFGITIGAKWGEINKVAGSDTYTYTYIYNEKVAKAATKTDLQELFDGVTISPDITNDQLALLNNVQISINAYAVQAQTFTTASDALVAAYPAVFTVTNG